MRFIYLLLSLFVLSAHSLAEPVPYVDENDILHKRHSLKQTHTGPNQTEIHAVLPRMKKYRLKIQKIENEQLVGEPVFIEPFSERPREDEMFRGIKLKDLLMNKSNTFHIDNLDPNSEYHLELLEKGNSGESPSGDTRRFRTLDPKKMGVNFTVASCACDEVRYNDVKLPMWTQKRLTKPDLMIWTGDGTYVDSFDVVIKPDITELMVWQRYLDNFQDSPGNKFYRMIPEIGTWDDHDSSNNANKNTPTLKLSLELFNMLYGGRTIPGVIENGHDGTYKWLTYGGFDFMLFDARTFREPYETPEFPSQRGYHFGMTQEDFYFTRAAKSRNFQFLIKGDMFGNPLVTETKPNGESKRIIESMHADHPVDYAGFMERLRTLDVLFAQVVGDIHRAQFIRLGPNQTGPRYNDQLTSEWIFSPFYSFLFNPADKHTPSWPDKDRYGHINTYNFGFVSAKVTGKNLVTIDVRVQGDGKTDMKGLPRDWQTLAEPLLTDRLINRISKSNFQNSTCLSYYRK